VSGVAAQGGATTEGIGPASASESGSGPVLGSGPSAFFPSGAGVEAGGVWEVGFRVRPGV